MTQRKSAVIPASLLRQWLLTLLLGSFFYAVYHHVVHFSDWCYLGTSTFFAAGASYLVIPLNGWLLRQLATSSWLAVMTIYRSFPYVRFMRLRLRLFEFEDLSWFPNVIRTGMMDYLRFMISMLGIYRPIAPLLAEGLRRTGQRQLLELGAGSGGGTETVWQALGEAGVRHLRITLTDLYPQPAAWHDIAEHTHGAIGHEDAPVDALAVPGNLRGFRVIFSAFHHFPPAAAEALLHDAVRAGTGIGVFEGAGKHWAEVLLAWTVLPVAQLLLTPFFRPFRLSRLFFTYLVPLIPLCTIWDGTVSILRLYSSAELLALAQRADPTGTFAWQAGKKHHRWGPEVSYLIGWPK